MIFSNKIYKVSSGKNPAIYAENNQEAVLTVFKNLTEKKQLCFSPTIKCLNTSSEFGYNKVIKLDNSFSLICLDKYISIVENIL